MCFIPVKCNASLENMLIVFCHEYKGQLVHLDLESEYLCLLNPKKKGLLR